MVETTNNPEIEIKRLRNQMALLISKNLDLQRRLDEFELEKTGLSVTSIGASLVSAIRSAEVAMADEAPADKVYVISELQASLRGFLSRQDGELTLRLPRPEQTVPPDNLGKLEMTVRSMPTRILPDAVIALSAALEAAQLTFTLVSQKTADEFETNAVDEIIGWSSHLLANLHHWQEESFAQPVRALAEAAQGLAKSLQLKVATDSVEQLQAITKNLTALTSEIGKSRPLTSENIESLTVVLGDFTRQYQKWFLE